jgi:hypothetical protein
MENKDILLSTIGAEEPILHTISIDGHMLHIAIELQKIVLLGCSINSVNSEYRSINLNSQKVKQLINGGLKKECGIYYRMHNIISKHIKNNTMAHKKHELKNLSGHGICFSLIYYVILKQLRFTEEQYVDLNNFATIVEVINLFDAIIGNTKLPIHELKEFASILMSFGDNTHRIGSKLLTITRHQINNTSNLEHSVWKSMYINRIIRNIPLSIRQSFLAPSLDWGIIYHPSKHIFTNEQLLSKLQFGSNINYIRTTAVKQHALVSDLYRSNLKNHELEEIKQLTMQLKDTTIDIDYALDNLALVIFYSNLGKTLFNTINSYVEDAKSNLGTKEEHIIGSIFTDFEAYKQLIFQYLYCTMLLAQHGIIHNDPHLNNILIVSKPTSKLEGMLPTGKTMYAGETRFNLTLIDFDKSILSHHHHNFFDKVSGKINEEIGIVFDDVKKTITSNYAQVFNCYIMYDVIRFCLTITRVLQDAKQTLTSNKNIDITKQEEFTGRLIKLASDILYKIFDEDTSFPFDVESTYGSITWLIESTFKDYFKSSKTKSSIETAAQMSKMKSSVSNEHPEFVSSRRKFADKLKYNYISEYVSNNKMRSEM